MTFKMPEPDAYGSSMQLDAYTADAIRAAYNAGLEDALQVATPDDTYTDDWFYAKADVFKRISNLIGEHKLKEKAND